MHSWCKSKKAHKRFLNERDPSAIVTRVIDDDEDIEDITATYALKELRPLQFESSDGIYEILVTDSEEMEVQRCKETIENFLSRLKRDSIEFLAPKHADTVVQMCKYADKNYNTSLDLLKVLMTIQHQSFYGTQPNGNVYDFLLPF